MLRMIAPIIAAFLVAGLGLNEASRHGEPIGADEYHNRIQNTIQLIPYRIGDWVGVDTEIRQEALRILDANVSMSRSYVNVMSGAAATLLIVHCEDSRRLLGHYPPVCYPSQGWTQVTSALRSVGDNGPVTAGTEYAFSFETLDRAARLSVYHFTVLPDGRSAPDMELLEATARDRYKKYLGGASVQIVVDANLPEAERIAIYGVMLEAASEWIKVVQAGVTQ